MAPDLTTQKEGVKKIEQMEQDIVKNNVTVQTPCTAIVLHNNTSLTCKVACYIHLYYNVNYNKHT